MQIRGFIRPSTNRAAAPIEIEARESRALLLSPRKTVVIQMTMPPTCPITGRCIRHLLLLACLSYFVYFLVDGITETTASRTVYICDTEDSVEMMIECISLEDTTTCSDLTDSDGNTASCIQSSCGYRLFPHIDVSVAGTTNPYDASAATSTTTFLSVMSIFYGIVPYVLGFVFIVEFLAFGNLVPLARLLVLGVIAIVNDFIFKNLFEQHRPHGSCLYFLSFGMPR